MTFLSRLDADTWLAIQGRKVSSEDWGPPSVAAAQGATVEEFAPTSIARSGSAPAPLALYDKLLRLEILPTFGDRKAREITTAQVTDWYNAMGRRPTQQANAYSLFTSILKGAVDSVRPLDALHVVWFHSHFHFAGLCVNRVPDQFNEDTEWVVPVGQPLNMAITSDSCRTSCVMPLTGWFRTRIRGRPQAGRNRSARNR